MLSVYVDGVGEVVARLDRLDARMTKELRGAIQRLTIKLQSKVKADKLSGQVLGVRTGRLKRSIQQDVQVDGSKVTGVVSTNLDYGIGWETGWQGGGRQSLKAAKSKFGLSGSGDTFANGTPKQRAFLVPSLKEFEASGAISEELSAAVGRAVE